MNTFLKKYKEAVISFVALTGALLVEHIIIFEESQYVYLMLYGLSYLAVGGSVWIKAFISLKNGTLFSEFFLMGIATVGAFAIGEYAEGVAVMLFYTIGEYAQHGAVHKARNSIKKLIDQQPDVATVERDGETLELHPSKVNNGDIVLVRPGDKVPLDGELITERASFNTAALTGESKPMTINSGEEVWAGSINQDTAVRIKVTSSFKDTKLSNILNMVQEASKRKAPTQRFITRFAKVYTPIVVWLAVAITFLPYLFIEPYVFQEWFYRALIFLVVSCPCGLVISVPLGYFGGIGAASGNGILFKGSDYLDQLRKMNILFMDKTGTLTKGSFEVQSVQIYNGISENELITYAASLEQQSSHPIGKAILGYKKDLELYQVENQQEISGKGLKGSISGKNVLVGNLDLLKEHQVKITNNDHTEPYTYVHIAIDGEHAGTISIADEIKEDSNQAIKELKERGIQKLVVLSGDNQEVVSYVAKQLGLDEAYGNLLPDEKYKYVEEAIGNKNVVGFIGDGVNDAPVITLSDIGIAMGGIGSDATIETADVVIQTDHPSKLPIAIDISKFTHRIVWQNIGFALGIKILVMVLAAFGIATMWEAIFADVGVALIAIGNAIRIQSKFSESKSLFSFFTSSSDDSQQDFEEAPSCC
ncbi:MAG TPA: cadmium-translocating P-type ATPase [Balneola sp.]|jgi:Zn2+/Cd2+-exporting ATPase|nr:cadmium-translocating P-type ATPase [Balneola sp.]MAO78838.1 cadmium-translocating P-type ATPase [Balneola sp.]MBF63497.1 cadmium-translocating P-type ATPase [Balneola sp.]HBZ38869.1 cadmium-translocating P-type ATPase [Balneola sp.]|tara:strand:- start:8768 stop:10711 length:1944 start_codon:yes stop_codon:yes gene_type:complete